MEGDIDQQQPENLSELLRGLVRERLVANDWSQNELARATGVSPKHLSQLLNGRAVGSIEVWNRLLTAVSDHDGEEDDDE